MVNNMKNCLVFDSKGFNDYVSWQSNDSKVLKRINDLIKSIQREGPNKGIGKPEVLKGTKGKFSRRIDDKNRLVYEVFDENNTFVLSCLDHYAKLDLIKGLHTC